MSYNFKNLVFEGGGIKGFSYCGVIKELESKNMLKNFNKFAGTSSGSIFASLLAAEFTADEILEIQNLELNIFKFSSYFFSFYNKKSLIKGTRNKDKQDVQLLLRKNLTHP